MVTVTDTEILSAIPELARATGVFGEPAGVTGFAGFRKMARQGLLGKNERVAVIVTGNGLKDIEGAKKSVGEPVVIDADLGMLREILGEEKRTGSKRTGSDLHKTNGKTNGVRPAHLTK
jgi:threonine synthase